MKGAGGQPGSGGLPASGEAGETVLAEGEGAGLSRRIARALGDSAIRMAPTPSSPQVLQSSAAFVQPLLAGGLTGGRTEAELLAGSAETLAGTLGLSGEVPGLTQLLAEASIGTNAAHRPEAPRMIAAQLAEAFAAKGEQKVEVSLNPQELGHVRMRVIAAESGITMVIHTERPETGDLMRRHIHELAEEFRRMGYEDVSFEFSGGEAGSGQPGQDSDGGSAASRTAGANGTGAADGNEPEKQNLRLGSSGVDMRV
ncbi:flagellar hook-length control protein FliK [Leisingera sp. ANG-Vp]|uniref:flagellar hook-length control protein FliK n=1 Tax=Leisingera sp. ANG-Vp TaxID=1577896 RepID=UPI0019D33D59|nr:flagellar hook-length control protein FliK [Leisingera sp. ANG-Vp]